MKQKFLDLAGLTVYDGKIKEWIKSGLVDITDDEIRALFVVGPADNEIWYTSKDGNIVTPNAVDVFGANIVSNTYEDGKGIIKFDNNVTSIGKEAFDDCSSLASVTIPNSVTNIGQYAFRNCSSLTSITIPDSVTSIRSGAFVDCSSLTYIAMPNSITIIDNGVFYYCSSLASITIPKGVKRIVAWAFYFCDSLTSVTIPDSVTNIERFAFKGCRSLTSITFEGTTEEWDNIMKGDEWDNTVPATYVQCSDGQVPL